MAAGYGFEGLPADGFKALADLKGKDMVGEPHGWAFWGDQEPHRLAYQQTSKGLLVSIKTEADDDKSWESHFYPFL